MPDPPPEQKIYNKVNFATQVPNKRGPYEYSMSRDKFLKGKLQSFPAPGQTPEAAQNYKNPTDWIKKGLVLQLPKVVQISIVMNPFMYSSYCDVRTNSQSPWWGYPFDGIMQSDFNAFPYANYGIQQSFAGPGIAGWTNLAPQGTYFPEMFDTVWNGPLWEEPPEVVPARFRFGGVTIGEQSYLQRCVTAALSVKRIIQNNNKLNGRVFVNVSPYLPVDGYNWLVSDFHEKAPYWKLNPDGNPNGPSKWNDTYEEIQLGFYGGIAPPPKNWRDPDTPHPPQLPFIDWNDPLNQTYNFAGPTELLIPMPFPSKPFVGCDVLHIYIGYRSYMGGPNLSNALIGALKPAEVEAIYAGFPINHVAEAAVDGFESSIAKGGGLSTLDMVNLFKLQKKFWPRYETKIFGPPAGMFNSSIAYQDIRRWEQNIYWSGGTLVDGLNKNLYLPSIFNGGDPDNFIEGVFVLKKWGGNFYVDVPFWYPITVRMPPNNNYTLPHGQFGPFSVLEMIQRSTAKMNMYYSDLQSEFSDAFWRATMKIYPGLMDCGVQYMGQSNIDQTSLLDLILQHFKLSMT